MRRPSPFGRTVVAGITLSALTIGGCSDSVVDRGSLDHGAATAVSIGALSCASNCVVIADNLPTLDVAPGDSAEHALWLGEATVQGTLGGSIALRLTGPQAGILQVPAGVELVVNVSGTISRIPLSRLGDEYLVYRFSDSRAVHVTYSISRSSSAGATIHAQLLQVTRQAQVTSRDTPLALSQRATAGIMAAPGFDSACPFTASGTWCYLNITIFPSTAQTNWGADFQSQSGTGQSKSIIVQFGADISSLSIMVYDPDFAGNQVVAYDSTGRVVATVDVPYDNSPGHLTIESITVSASRIRKVVLVAATGDYVAYGGATFIRAPCPPTGNAFLDSPDIRKGLLDLLAASRPNPNGTGKKELGDYIYQNSDGSYGLLPINDPNATDCAFTVPGGTPTLPDGAILVGVVHTHPSKGGERVTGCRGQLPGEIRWASRDPKAGGGSPQDWASADDSGAPMWVMDLDGRIFRLDPNVPPSKWSSNPNRWLMSSKSDCIKKAT